MSSAQETPIGLFKAKKSTNAPPTTTSGTSPPTTFFLRSEREMMDNTSQRGRKLSREASGSVQQQQQQPTHAELSTEAAEATNAAVPSTASTLKRAGNPVHPTILATGQRILSFDHTQTHTTRRSPSSTSASTPYLRRNSASSSSLNLSSTPLTPLRMSPRPESLVISTPRSTSCKSFRLSDEEEQRSVDSDGRSQAVVSSSGDEGAEDAELGQENEEKQAQDVHAVEGQGDSSTQFIMPSLTIPTRRPFTSRGRNLGRLKLMIAGAAGLGKTTLVQSLSRICEDIVHTDPPNPTQTFNQPADLSIVEIAASTRPYPAWWTDFESRRMLLRRKSSGEGVLERNLVFVDTPSLDGEGNARVIRGYFEALMARAGNMTKMNDSELVHVLSGEGGLQVDAVLYLFSPELATIDGAREDEAMVDGSGALDDEQIALLRYLSQWTNLIPLIARSDTVAPDMLQQRKQQLRSLFRTLDIEICSLQPQPSTTGSTQQDQEPPEIAEPFAISSAPGSDPETLDASILMSSSYLPPLVPSELERFAEMLFDSETAARLRHVSAAKFLLWRREHLGTHLDLLGRGAGLLAGDKFARSRHGDSGEAEDRDSSGGALEQHSAMSEGEEVSGEDPSKILLPHADSSFYRSTSPSTASDALSATRSGAEAEVDAAGTALALYSDTAHVDAVTETDAVPFRQMRLAKWARDLQRSLEKERRRYKDMFAFSPTRDWLSGTALVGAGRSSSSHSGDGSSASGKGKGRDEGKSKAPFNSSPDRETLPKPSAAAQSASALPAAAQMQSQHRPAKGRLGGPPSVIDPNDPLGVLALAQAARRQGWFALQFAGSAGLVGAVAWWCLRNWVQVSEFLGLGHGQGSAVGGVWYAIPPPTTPVGVSQGTGEGGFDWRGLVGWSA